MPSAPLDVRLARALSHPLRQRILLTLDGREASPSELASELRAPLGDVAYHTKRLAHHGCVELVRTERRSGAVRHLYTATRHYRIDDPEWIGMAPAARDRVAAQVLSQLLADTHAAQAAGRLAAADLHLSRVPLELDGRAVEELNHLLRDLVSRALALQEESRSRQGSAVERRLAMLHYEPAGPEP